MKTKFAEWLDAETGRNKALAKHFSLTRGAISQWRNAVPRSRMRAVFEFCNGDVDYADMLPLNPVPRRRKAVSKSESLHPGV